MQVVHPVSEWPHYNNNLKFCLTNIGMITRGYIQYSIAWGLIILKAEPSSVDFRNFCFENQHHIALKVIVLFTKQN